MILKLFNCFKNSWLWILNIFSKYYFYVLVVARSLKFTYKNNIFELACFNCTIFKKKH